ncbi:MAG: response regulator [Actinomycetaceae bacterium]
MITVLLADDHAAIRAGLRMMISTADDIDVVGEAAEGRAAVTNARALRPDVVVMDVRMPGVDGVEATRQIVAERLSQVLVLTTFDVDEVVFGALEVGAAGFLLKTAEPEAIIAAVRAVAAGDGVVAPEVTRRVLAAFTTPDGAARHGRAAGGPTGEGPEADSTGVAEQALLDELTGREVEVLAALGRGLSNQAIAAELFIAEATVKTHVSRVLAKLQVTSRMQAAIRAREAGLA